MLIDFHAHSKGISKCCKIDGEDMILVTPKAGMDGVILTNHYDKSYLIDNDEKELANRYVKEFYYVKECGEQIGFKVFFGIEVTMEKHDYIHMLVYGVDPNFLIENPSLYDLTINQLSNLVHQNNGILVQAHPFRNGKNKLVDLKYLDGVEVNCHPLYDGTHLSELCKIAKENNLLLTCGGDFHNDTHRPTCGVYLKEDLKDCKEIIDYLIKQKSIELCVQEVDEKIACKHIFSK